MRAVHHKVNIVPVIAKADTLTRSEVIKLKTRVRYLRTKSCVTLPLGIPKFLPPTDVIKPK